MTDINRNLLEFSVRIFNGLAIESQYENISFSPTSIYLALAILNVGANEESREELKSLLGVDFSVLISGLNSEIENVKNSINELLISLNKSTKLNNKIYTKIEIKEDFKNIIKEIFRTFSESLDFQNSKMASEIINKWVEEATNGRIKNIINESSLNSDIAILIINTIYFSANWEDSFDEKQTKYSKFVLEDNREIMTQIMKCTCVAEIFKDQQSRFISLTKSFYEYGIVGVFILPAKNQNSKDFILEITVLFFK